MKLIKFLFKVIRLFIPKRILDIYYENIRRKRAIKHWEDSGRQVPAPDVVKQMIVSQFQKKYKIKTLVETGTFLGAMVNAQKNNFQEIHTVELSEKYYKDAKEQFRHYQHIHLYKGDSSDILKSIVPNLRSRTIYWLDAHYSIDIFARGKSDCPIFEELDAIFTYNPFKNIILIDDAREFNGVGDYPSRQQVFDYVKSKDPTYSVTIETDIFRCVPA